MNKQRIARIATLIGYFGLLILIIFWAVYPTTLGQSVTSMALVFGGVPLLIGLRGIIKENAYTHAWICIISLGYMIHGVLEAWSNPKNLWLGIIEVVLSVFLYLGAGFFARYRAREIKQEHAQEKLTHEDLKLE